MHQSAPPRPATPRPDLDRLVRGLALVFLSLLAMGMLWGNPFVQDDLGIINFNKLAHQWSGTWRAFLYPYWPPLNSGELYRPLIISWFTVQWLVGDGAVWPFRLASLLLYAGLTVVVWRFLHAHTTATAAWLAAALFAVHPVHVEAVALAVNQAELLVGILLTLALGAHLRGLRGELPPRRAATMVWWYFFVALWVKENALILPGLLVAADLMLEADREEWRPRLRRQLPLYLALITTGALFWIIRGQVLGPGAGTHPAEALVGLSMAERAYTMLGVPAEWLRLLIWPATLQGDWNLLEWVPTGGWTLRETAGVIALASATLAFALAWRRRPLLAFGIAWIAVTLVPVSNVLIPSGIIIAERTLLLASIGIVIVAADLVSLLEPRWLGLGRPARLAVLSAIGVLLFVGLIRSGVRHTAWRSRPLYLASQAQEAPTSWHARLAYGILLSDIGDTASARREISYAIDLRADDPLVSRGLADAIRYREGKCIASTIIYEEILRRRPGRSEVRGSLVACYLHLGRYAAAGDVADGGVALHLDEEYFRHARAVADSAIRVAAPEGTVRLPRMRNFTVIGPPPE